MPEHCPDCGAALDPPDTGRPPPAGPPAWLAIRGELVAAVACPLAIMVLFRTDALAGTTQRTRNALASGALAFGIGFALSASRRGTVLSRVLGSLLLVLYSLVLLMVIAITPSPFR